MDIEVGCRIVPTPKELKGWGRTDEEVEWELEKIEEINEGLERESNETWRSGIKLVWERDAVLPEVAGGGQEERRGR